MRLSCDPKSPDYHKLAHFAARVTIDGKVVPNIVSVDMDAGEAVCFKTPFVVIRGEIETYVTKGKIEIDWRTPIGWQGQQGFVAELYKDWVAREKERENNGTTP